MMKFINKANTLFLAFNIIVMFYIPKVLAQDEIGVEVDDREITEEHNPSLLHQVLLYVPNRIFDLLDIFRIKVKLGPGFDVGAQITRPIRLYAGGHSAIYAGLPGPRLERIVPIPVGAEAKAGGAISVLDGIVQNNSGTSQTESEIAVEAQLLLAGIEVGIDPVEIADFFTGFAMYEIRDDDL